MDEFPKNVLIDSPFGANDTEREPFNRFFNGSDVGNQTVSNGFTATPFMDKVESGGRIKKVSMTRHHMNEVGYLSTLGLFLGMIGYPKTGIPYYRIDDSGKGLGEVRFPKGASYFTHSFDGRPSEVYHRVEYPRQELTPGDDAINLIDGIVQTDGIRHNSFFPRFKRKEEIVNRTLTSNQNVIIRRSNIDSCWLLIERKFEEYPEGNDDLNARSIRISTELKYSYDYDSIDDFRTSIPYWAGQSYGILFPVASNQEVIDQSGDIQISTDYDLNHFAQFKKLTIKVSKLYSENK